uniref:Wsv133-like protein n=1 Tax=Melicertus latisulcatus pemonivirus TaxID=2984278 RepID=A0A9C7EYJ8_9VIRU|nr:MAG: wsv133-like protein [Melicertus latisulcatus pemonivirus]
MKCRVHPVPCISAVARELNYLKQILRVALPTADDVNVNWDSLANEASVVALMAGAGTIVGHQLTTDCSRLQKQGESLAKMVWGSHLNACFRSTLSADKPNNTIGCANNDHSHRLSGGRGTKRRNDSDRSGDRRTSADNNQNGTPEEDEEEEEGGSHGDNSSVSPKYRHWAKTCKECRDEIGSPGTSRSFPDRWDFSSQQFVDRTVRLPVASLYTNFYRYRSTTSTIDIKCPTVRQNPNCQCYRRMEESSLIH